MACTCHDIPRNRMGTYLVPAAKDASKLVACGVFHMDCPEHGIQRTAERPMRAVRRQHWATVPEALGLRLREQACLVGPRKDGKALIEWTEWLPAEDEQPGVGTDSKI